MVRGQRSRLCVRPPGNGVLSRLVEITADAVRCVAPKPRRRATPLHRDPLWRPILGLRAARRGTHRGRRPGIGHRYMVTSWTAEREVALRHALLRARPGREPDRAAQGPACLDRTSFARHSQSGAPRAAYRRYWLMLTVRDAIASRIRSPTPSSPPCVAPPQNRRAHHRAATRVASPCRSMPRPPHCFAASPSASSPPDRNTTVLRPRAHPVPPTSNTVMNLTDFAMNSDMPHAPAHQTARPTSMR